MKKIMLAAGFAAVSALANAYVLDKTPDLGPFWHPLGVSPDTSIYADSLIFTGANNDSTLSQVGVYLRSQGGAGQPLKYYLLKDNNNAPTSTILSTSVANVSTSSDGLVLLTANMSAVNLVNGTRYWVAAQGQGGGGAAYQVGGHTQNSGGINDNGTFWYSNNNDFNNFDGQRLTPEMAIYVKTVPEPASMIALGAGLLALARRRRK